MSAYVMARLRKAPLHADLAEYIERLPATFAPYGGRFLVHVTAHEVLEGVCVANGGTQSDLFSGVRR